MRRSEGDRGDVGQTQGLHRSWASHMHVARQWGTREGTTCRLKKRGGGVSGGVCGNGPHLCVGGAADGRMVAQPGAVGVGMTSGGGGWEGEGEGERWGGGRKRVGGAVNQLYVSRRRSSIMQVR